jgi:tripartite-type tricarboxylate transporter receptor subunit TctC
MPHARFVVPFGFDGAADRVARAFVRAFAGDESSVAIENVPGEGGLLGVRRANELAGRGDTPVLLLATPSTHLLLPLRLGPTAAPSRAFNPVLGLGSAPNVLLASPALGVRTVEELIARSRSGDLVYASAGVGQTIHVCTAFFCELAGIAMTHRPFERGSTLAYGELAAGRVHVYFDNLLGCRGAIEGAEVVALAVSSDERSPLLPDVPTLAECGFREHALDVWFGVFGAHTRDAPLVDRTKDVGTDSSLSAALTDMGLSGGVRGPDALRDQVDASAPIWSKALAAIRLAG